MKTVRWWGTHESLWCAGPASRQRSGRRGRRARAHRLDPGSVEVRASRGPHDRTRAQLADSNSLPARPVRRRTISMASPPPRLAGDPPSSNAAWRVSGWRPVREAPPAQPNRIHRHGVGNARRAARTWRQASARGWRLNRGAVVLPRRPPLDQEAAREDALRENEALAGDERQRRPRERRRCHCGAQEGLGDGAGTSVAAAARGSEPSSRLQALRDSWDRYICTVWRSHVTEISAPSTSVRRVPAAAAPGLREPAVSS